MANLEEVGRKLLLAIFEQANVETQQDEKRNEAKQFLADKGIDLASEEWRPFADALGQLEALNARYGTLLAVEAILTGIINGEGQETSRDDEPALPELYL